jgi:hypothetical protein
MSKEGEKNGFSLTYWLKEYKIRREGMLYHKAYGDKRPGLAPQVPNSDQAENPFIAYAEIRKARERSSHGINNPRKRRMHSGGQK